MMADEKVKKVKLVKMPSFTRLFIGGLMAYWLSTIMNPAFVSIAVLMILLIPVLSVDNIFSRQFTRAYYPPPKIEPKVMSKSEYIELKTAEEIKNAPPVEPKKERLSL
jgi:hypothetical protein